MVESIRESWATRIGFVLAAVGSAVGLGNIWRFPFQVGQEGGSVFLVVYLAFVVVVGIPAMLVELSIGRSTRLNPVGALHEFGGGAWRYVGGVFVLIVFVILSYYSVVAGWILRYFVDSFTGAYMNQPGEHFVSIASGLDALAFHTVFMVAVVVIVALGVRSGIELAVKVMVPCILVLLAGLAVYAFTLDAASEAYAYYLTPDLGTVLAEWQSVLPAAAGQAFFTLSLGMGVMITYSSYISKDRNLSVDTGAIVVLDTFVAFVTGLIVFPILFTAGTDPADPGAGAIFVTLAGALSDIPFGAVVGVLFFGIVGLAALSSAISLMEVAVSYLIDEKGAGRKRAALGVGIATFVVGLPVTYDTVFVDLYDILAAQILLVGGALLLMVLVAWLNAEKAVEELEKGIGKLGFAGDAWVWLIRVPVMLVLLVSLYLGVVEYADFLTGDFAEFVFG
ncbi:MAG: sodium-dependent transporter [Halobacteriales archaeon]|nr:sodium-dependent transporter [Halobacteriales archaeon]